MANALVVVATLEMAHAILLEATLSFLGLGVQPPEPSWGLMLAEAKGDMFFNPWMITIPGVALFALQFARCFGARVIALTSTDAKAALLKKMGADAVVNYRSTPDWEVAVRAATGGLGVDIVVETVGNTLAKSLTATAFGGFVGVIGFVAGQEATINVRQLLGPMVRVQGIAVGSRERFEAMLRAMTLHKLHPVIDSTFPLARTAEAFRKIERAEHIGKITISL